MPATAGIAWSSDQGEVATYRDEVLAYTVVASPITVTAGNG